VWLSFIKLEGLNVANDAAGVAEVELADALALGELKASLAAVHEALAADARDAAHGDTGDGGAAGGGQHLCSLAANEEYSLNTRSDVADAVAERAAAARL